MLVHCRRCNCAVHVEESSAQSVCPYCREVVKLPTPQEAGEDFEAGQDVGGGQDAEAGQESQPESPFPKGIAWLLIAVGHFFIWFVVALPTSAILGAWVVLAIVLLELAVWQRGFLFSAIQSLRSGETTASAEPVPYFCATCGRQVFRSATSCPYCGGPLDPDDS